MPRTLIFAALASTTCLITQAGELIIEPGPFTITQSLSGTILPEKGTIAIPPLPEKWDDWQILRITPHGTRVAKGDVLVEFDTDTCKQKIEDTKHAIAAKSLALAQAEQDLAQLTSSSEHKIEALRTAARIAKEDHEYFTKTRRNTEEKSADQSLERAKQILANQEEELRQLKKMYEADDLTEETEEIILTRQQNAVKAASFALEMETLHHKRTREVILPREAVTLENQNRDASLALDEGINSLPRSIGQKSLEKDALKTDLQREKDNLAAWEKDWNHRIIQAPEDGWFFHGLIADGRWITGETTKSLVPGGRPPTARPFATFIPAKSPLSLYALTDDATARALSSGQPGTLIFPGREDLNIPGNIASFSPIPSPDGKHVIHFRPDWPKDLSPAVGTSANIRLVSYHKDAAISIPLKALHFGNGGFSVSVKLTDGKTERRRVQRGRLSGDHVEILEGLEKGQVVVIPES